jgi:hypothetical protein
MTVDRAKLAVVILVVLCASALLALERIDSDVWLGVVGPIGGYAIGNGVSVGTGNRPTTLLSRADLRTRADDAAPPPPPDRDTIVELDDAGGVLRPSDHHPPRRV